MTREILFKAVSLDGKWVEGDLYRPNVNDPLRHRYGDVYVHLHLGGGLIQVHPDTVCFASSRNDENKVRIFHGDIVEFTVFDYEDSDTQYTGTVLFTGDRFVIVHSLGVQHFDNDGPFDLDWVCDQDETILKTGRNIHDGKLK